jgi:hypothetical protein
VTENTENLNRAVLIDAASFESIPDQNCAAGWYNDLMHGAITCSEPSARQGGSSQAVKVANFSDIGRLKELMKRTDMDIARVSQVLVFEALSY